MTDDEICNAVRDFIVGLMRKCTTPQQRAEVASFTLQLGYELTRGIEGDRFMQGWLDTAQKDLRENPPKVVLRKLN